jgi:uncharacterized membrane protein
MNNYPDVVAKIADDYLARVNAQLGVVPNAERAEFVREIESHIYEAYQNTPGGGTSGGDDVTRILTVLRNLGEPADVVADRLSESIVRKGAKRSLPVYIVIGILIALFGIPLGLGGVGVVFGILLALAGVVIAYYAATGAVLLAAAAFLALGLTRIYEPVLWGHLTVGGYVRFDGPLDELMSQLSPPGQGFLLVLIAVVFAAAGVGMLWVGKHLLRGLRFLSSLVFDWFRRRAQDFRQRAKNRREAQARPAPVRLSVSR